MNAPLFEIKAPKGSHTNGRLSGWSGGRSKAQRPLGEIDLSTAEERGQGMLMVCDAGCGL